MRALFLGILLFLSASCAPTTVKKHDLVFFPAAPNPPRVQFLLGIGDSRDIEGASAEVSLFSMNSAQDNETKTFLKPYGVTVSGSKFYVTDTVESKVAVIDLRQKSFTWLKGNYGPGKLIKPINMTTDKANNLYIADTIRKQVVAYGPQGDFLRVYGSSYDMKPVDVAVDSRRLYILDISRHKILVFNKVNGDLIEGFGHDSENPEERLSLPTNMALTEEGLFYVANAGTGSIVKLDRDGHILGTFGKMGDGFGQFGRPKGVATDSKKRFYAVDAAHQNVQIFNAEDRLLMFFGDPGQPAGSLNIPAGIAVTDQDLDFYQQFAAPGFDLEQVILVVNQVGRHKINIYGLGKQRGIDYEAYYRETHEQLRKADAKRLEKKK